MDKNIKLICFDLDGTLLPENNWYKLNIALGVTPEEDLDMYNAYVRKELSYQGWIDALKKLYLERGRATERYVKEVLFSYKLREGTKAVIDDLKQKGYQLAIITGMMDVLANKVGEDLGIPYVKANTTITFDTDGNLADMKFGGDERDIKLKYLQELCDELGISMNECAALGNGFTDLPLFEATGHGITFENTAIAPHSWKTIETLKDLGGIFLLLFITFPIELWKEGVGFFR